MASNQKLVVDLEELRKLARTLWDEGDEIDKLLQSTKADIEALDATWAGSNHDRFNNYFEELYEDAMFFHAYVRFYADIMSRAITYYEKLMGEVDARMANALDGCN